MRYAGPSLVFGFSIAVSMWCVWFLTHLPGLNLDPAIVGALVVAAMIGVGLLAGRMLPRSGLAPPIGALAGFIASILNLLLLGSFLAQTSEGETGFHPSAGPAAAGFVALGTLIGTISVWAGNLSRGRRSAPPLPVPAAEWHRRFAIVAAVSVVPLLLIGGLVTSTGSGLAVPDWPSTYSANMFLYPIGLMTRPRIFLEHAHRLFGFLVGLTTLTLMIYTLVVRRHADVSSPVTCSRCGYNLAGLTREICPECGASLHTEQRSQRLPAWAKAWSIGLFVLVVAQGILGGVRVTNTSTSLALAHGVTAQIFFALMVAFATALSFRVNPAEVREHAARIKKFKIFATAATHSILLQLIFGAIYRHFRQPHALWTHMGFAIIVVIFAALAGFAAQRLAKEAAEKPFAKSVRRIGTGLIATVFLQFVLGWSAFLVVVTSERTVPLADQATSAPQVSTLAAIVPTLHQANGALLLAFATMAYVWAIGLKKAARLASQSSN